MPGALTSTQIVSLALQISKTGNVQNGNPVGFTSQAGLLLNNILSSLCQDYDLELARGTYNFNFTNATAAIGNTNVSLASGPFFLPPDYLRAKRGDIMWFLNNYPYQLVPVDIEEFDSFIQQAGFQNFPTAWATDMSQPQVLITTGNTNSNTTLDTLASTTGVAAGQIVLGSGIPYNTTVVSVDSSTQVTISNSATDSTSQTLIFQQPALAYVWPPAGGSYPCMVRYFRQMPPIDTPETSTVVPWFPNTDFLLRELAGQLMMLAGDDRWQGMLSEDLPTGSRYLLKKYLTLKDDTSNRAQRVTLDRRRFGYNRNNLPPSKILGY